MRVATIFILILLSACSQSIITPASYDAAFELCKPYGGLRWVTRNVSYSTYDVIEVTCENHELKAFMNVKKPTPATASSATQASR